MEGLGSLPIWLYSIPCNIPCKSRSFLGSTWLGEREVYPCIIKASQILMLKASWL